MTSEANSSWSVYMVQCVDGSLYTGATTDVAARVIKHNLGTGAKYTKTRLPVTLVYSETCDNHGRALKREHEIKQYPRSEKLQLAGY